MNNYFSSNLKYLRKKSRKNQEEWGLQLNIKRATLSNYEAGITEPDINKLIEISNFIGISLDSLLLTDLSKGNLTEIDHSIKNTKKGNLKGNPIGNPTLKNELERSDLSQIQHINEKLELQKENNESLKQMIEDKNSIISMLTADNDRLKRELQERIQDVEDLSHRKYIPKIKGG